MSNSSRVWYDKFDCLKEPELTKDWLVVAIFQSFKVVSTKDDAFVVFEFWKFIYFFYIFCVWKLIFYVAVCRPFSICLQQWWAVFILSDNEHCTPRISKCWKLFYHYFAGTASFQDSWDKIYFFFKIASYQVRCSIYWSEDSRLFSEAILLKHGFLYSPFPSLILEIPCWW